MDETDSSLSSYEYEEEHAINREIRLRRQQKRKLSGSRPHTATPWVVPAASSSGSTMGWSPNSSNPFLAASTLDRARRSAQPQDGTDNNLERGLIETALVAVPVVVAVVRGMLPLALDAKSAACAAAGAAVSLRHYRLIQFPQSLYLTTLPLLVCAIAFKSQPINGLVSMPLLNVALSLISLPFPAWLYEVVIATIGGNSTGRDDWLPLVYPLYEAIYEIIDLVCATSLTPTETSLFASLVVNLVMVEPSNPLSGYVRLLLMAPMLSIVPASPWLEKLMHLSRIVGHHRRPKNAEELKTHYAVCITLVFSITLAGLTVAYFNADMVQFNAFLRFLFVENVPILTYWGTILAVIIPLVMKFSPNWALDLRRKVWHLCVVVMFLPTVARSPHFVAASIAIALSLFLLSEFVRASAMPPFGLSLHKTLTPYTDHRDQCGPVIVSHIFLLLGVGLPILISHSPAGIICLGLGDAAASVFGRRFGRTHWPGSKKTIEGTLAFVTAVSFGLFISTFLYPSLAALHASEIVFIASSTAFLEACSGMNDNVIVPIYMLILLELSL